MHVIGTAGHVDHGKSTLVQALTGINPDRLKEEQARQMTIDLGFAWFTLPDGQAVGVVDVPGHRDFIENMLAGVGGIEAVILVVAADEGVMPQTREHLAILDLLQVEAGVVALTKADLVDAEWLQLVRADVAAVLEGTVLESAPLVAVSARTGLGLPQLVQALQELLARRPARPDRGRPRLPIDRVFSLPGFGTVVTGTLSDGSFSVGEEVELLPSGPRARIRGLQTHKTRLERALPGSRVAINLAGVETGELRRGQMVTRPGTLQPTTLIDARFRHLKASELPLKHNAEVKFFAGAAEVLASLRLLEGDQLAPGGNAWVQLVLSEPAAVVKGERFILRRPSPGATLGGGTVVDPHPPRRHRRGDRKLLARLETLARGTPSEILLQALESLGPTALAEAVKKAGLEGAAAAEAVAGLGTDLVELDGQSMVCTAATWSRLLASLADHLAAYHAAHPLRAGMPREELKSRLGLNARVFNAVVARAAAEAALLAGGAAVRLPMHQVVFNAQQQRAVDALLAQFRREPFNTPSFKDCAAGVGEEVLSVLLDQGRLVPLSAEVLLAQEDYAAAVERIRAHLRAHGKITVAEVRDVLGTSRKYALALMEHLDTQGVTRRVGDERVLKGA